MLNFIRVFELSLYPDYYLNMALISMEMYIFDLFQSTQLTSGSYKSGLYLYLLMFSMHTTSVRMYVSSHSIGRTPRH